jgi:hypothetical protein
MMPRMATAHPNVSTRRPGRLRMGLGACILGGGIIGLVRASYGDLPMPAIDRPVLMCLLLTAAGLALIVAGAVARHRTIGI